MDADAQLVSGAAAAGADRVELYTEPYAAAFARGDHAPALAACVAAARVLELEGLGVNAGHDLNLSNLGPFLSAVPGVLEVSIGHALIADALEYGLAETVRRYLAIVRGAG
jgi:pyridoxine 5-phosphate synthase